MNDEQIKYMVDRFLGFGTNLFDREEAEEMVRYLIDGLPEEGRDALAAENERLLALLRDIETADKPPDADWCTPPWSDLCDRINAAIAKEPTT